MTRRAGLDVTFPWSPAGVLGCLLRPVHLVPGLWERKVRRKDSSVSDCGGPESVALARGTWEEFVGVRRVRRVSARAQQHGL